MIAKKITQVNFTWALPGGLWVKYEDGSKEWISYADFVAQHGQDKAAELNKIAHHGGMTGMWYNAGNGGNVYANGKEVNG